MKTLIVFLAMLLVLSSFLIFVTDSDNYVKLQKNLKALAQECAAGGALFYSDSSSETEYTVDIGKANEYAAFILSESRMPLVCMLSENCSISIETTSFTNEAGNTCTRSVCTWQAINGYRLFRLSFLASPQTVAQSSVYEIKK